MQNYQTVKIRDSAILTTSYVAGTILGIPNGAVPNLMLNDQLSLLVDFTIGSLTSMEYKIESAIELLYNLAYDGQSANFTVGTIVTGGTSGAKGYIVSDTDSGATGTLVLRLVDNGKLGVGFIDNEALTDTATGVAVVNGAMDFTNYGTNISDNCWFVEASESISSTTTASTVTETPVTRQENASMRIVIDKPIKYQYMRISFKGTGTTTNSLCAATAIVGTTGTAS